ALVGGVAWGLKRYAFHARGLRAQGEVVGSEERRSSLYPIVEFNGEWGQVFICHLSTAKMTPDL
ncbi:MAG: hypothetical protein AAB091_03895, partial [Elusimicrobiota bacterium]